jgi:hypothetical protein
LISAASGARLKHASTGAALHRQRTLIVPPGLRAHGSVGDDPTLAPNLATSCCRA